VTDHTHHLDITASLRAHQEKDPILGDFFAALHTFADRTMDEFYADTPGMPHPVVAMEQDRVNRLGYYTQRDGYALVHRINLNPYAHTDGEQAAETLAHEIVHLWQAHVGRPIKRDYHGVEFHQRMAEYGIETTGKRGKHVRYIDITWPNWMEMNADLELGRFSLPGKGKQRSRRLLLKHVCPDCGASFRNRVPLEALCLACNVPFEVQEPSNA